MTNKIIAYTDGSCKANGTEHAIGGWAFTCFYDNGMQLIRLESGNGYEKGTTNNRMEMLAIYQALRYIEDWCIRSHIENPEIVVYTDSAYCYNAWKEKWYWNWAKNGWKTSSGTPVKNQDLWIYLIGELERDFVTLEKVKGHADNAYNNEVDMLAQLAAWRGQGENEN